MLQFECVRRTARTLRICIASVFVSLFPSQIYSKSSVCQDIRRHTHTHTSTSTQWVKLHFHFSFDNENESTATREYLSFRRNQYRERLSQINSNEKLHFPWVEDFNAKFDNINCHLHPTLCFKIAKRKKKVKWKQPQSALMGDVHTHTHTT